MQGAFARSAVWSVPALNLALGIAVAIRPPPRSPVVEWPQHWALLSPVTVACAPSASTRAPSACAKRSARGLRPPPRPPSIRPSLVAIEMGLALDNLPEPLRGYETFVAETLAQYHHGAPRDEELRAIDRSG